MVKKTWAKLSYISNPRDQLKWAKGLYLRCVKDTPSSIETLPWSIHFCPVQSIHVIFVHPQWFENPSSPGKLECPLKRVHFEKVKVKQIVFHSHHFSRDMFIFEGVNLSKIRPKQTNMAAENWASKKPNESHRRCPSWCFLGAAVKGHHVVGGLVKNDLSKPEID